MPLNTHTEGHGCLGVLLSHIFSHSKGVFSWRLLRIHCLGQLLQQACDRFFHPMIRTSGKTLVSNSVSTCTFVLSRDLGNYQQCHIGNPKHEVWAIRLLPRTMGSGGKPSEQTRDQCNVQIFDSTTQRHSRGWTLFKHVNKTMSGWEASFWKETRSGWGKRGGRANWLVCKINFKKVKEKKCQSWPFKYNNVS